MENLIIVYSRFIRPDGTYFIGGIETYIHLLIEALKEQYIVTVVFPTEESYILNENGFAAIGVASKNYKGIRNFIRKEYDPKNTKIIVGSDQIPLKLPEFSCILIQHGVYWDLPMSAYRNKIYTLSFLFKLYDNLLNIWRIKPYDSVVCVDYNYLNWRRTVSSRIREKNYHVITNCAGESFFSKPQKLLTKKKILFARRFVELRGVFLFAEAISRLIEKYENIEVTICGDGPREKDLKEILPSQNNVKYTSKSYAEMPQVVKDCDIIIIPSLGSEGTSLTAIEGMAAGKIVLATNVGGLTNIILHGFNGFLFKPTVQSLSLELERILNMSEEKLLEVQKNAFQVASTSFTYPAWKEKWKQVLK